MTAVTTTSVLKEDAWAFRDPEVKVKPQVFFTEPDDEKGSAVPAPTVEKVKVRVRAPYRVVVDGRAHAGGDVVDAPRSVTELWLGRGWVEPLPVEQPEPAKKARK